MRDSQTGYLLPVRDAQGTLPDLESCWDAVAVAAVIWKFRLTFWLGNYIWSFSYGFGVVVRDILKWRPGFYSEFRYKSYEHSGLAWGAILGKVFVLTLFPRLPCSFFQEHIPKMDSFPMLFTHPTRPPARPSAHHGSQVIKMIGFPVFPGSKLNQNEWIYI